MSNLNNDNRGLNWVSVHYERQDTGYTDRFSKAYRSLQPTIELTKRNFNVNASELAEAAVSTLMSQVVADLMPMCGIENPPVIIPASLEDAGLVVKGNENTWYIGLDADVISEALLAQDSEKNNGEANSDDKTARLVYSLAHEMGHIRQREVLGMEVHQDIPLAPEIEAKIIERHGFEVGSRMVKRYEYEANVAETHANAFAVRYISAKKRDPNVKSFWRDLDLQKQMRSKWRTITNALLYKKATAFINKAKDRDNVFIDGENDLRALGQSYESARTNGMDKILSMVS